MRSTFRLFLSVPARKCRFLWEWNVSERRRPACLPSSLSRLWSANSIVSERSLHLFSSEVSRAPCDAFSRIYKVCNLPCVGFLIFWIAEIKHALLLGGILLDSRGFLLSLITTDLCYLRVPPGLWNVSSHIIRFTLGSCLPLYIFGNTIKAKVTQCTRVDLKRSSIDQIDLYFIFKTWTLNLSDRYSSVKSQIIVKTP